MMMLEGLSIIQLEELLEYLTKELSKVTSRSKKFWKINGNKDQVTAELKERKL